MGLDFLRRASNSFTKSWNRGKKDLALPTLFTRYPECRTRTVIAELVDNLDVAEGTNVILYAKELKLILLNNNARIGEVKHPPRDLYNAIHESGDCALAHLTRINPLSGTANVEVE